jgi:hypothetical protein
MDAAMILIEQIEAGGHPRVQSPKLREVVEVFDLMMTVQVLKEVAQPRHERIAVMESIRPPFAELGRQLFEVATLLPKMVMHLKPEI